MAKKKAEPAAIASVAGHVIRPRYREFTCDWVEYDEGEEPFRATIRVNLSFGEIDALPPLLGTTYADLWRVLQPHVTAWNLLTFDLESGQQVPVPPPAEAGLDAFRATDPLYTQWMFMVLKTGHLGGPSGLAERKNVPGPSGDGPEPEN